MTQDAVFRRPERRNVCNSDRLKVIGSEFAQAAFHFATVPS